MNVIDLDIEDCVIVLTIEGDRVSLTRSQLIKILQNSALVTPSAGRSTHSHETPKLPPEKGAVPKRKNAVASIAAILRELTKKHAPPSDADQARLAALLDSVHEDEVPAQVTGRLGATLEQLASNATTGEVLRRACQTFIKRFPQVIGKATPGAISAEGLARIIELNQNARRILIITESREHVETLREGLPSDYQVLPATSGDEIARYLEWRRIDLIIVELGITFFDAIDLVRLIHAHNTLKVVPIVGYAERATGEQARRFRDAGGEALIQGPFDWSVFVNRTTTRSKPTKVSENE